MRQLLRDLFSLVRAPYGNSKKIALLPNYLCLSMASGLGRNRARVEGHRLLGWRVSSFNYPLLHFLVREVFIEAPYHFTSTRENPRILDCGANIGIATLFFKWLYPNSSVCAFEPDPQTFALLKGNVERNGLSSVQLHNAALSECAGNVEFFVDAQNPGSLRMSTRFDRMPKQKIMVPAVQLSAYLGEEEVDLLKLDVEGAEEEVLRELAASGRLVRIREMIVEYHHLMGRDPATLSRFLHILEEHGFDYQIHASCIPLSARNRFQDIMIHGYRR